MLPAHHESRERRLRLREWLLLRALRQGSADTPVRNQHLLLLLIFLSTLRLSGKAASIRQASADTLILKKTSAPRCFHRGELMNHASRVTHHSHALNHSGR